MEYQQHVQYQLRLNRFWYYVVKQALLLYYIKDCSHVCHQNSAAKISFYRNTILPRLASLGLEIVFGIEHPRILLLNNFVFNPI